jgi:hypothetical protein
MECVKGPVRHAGTAPSERAVAPGRRAQGLTTKPNQVQIVPFASVEVVPIRCAVEVQVEQIRRRLHVRENLIVYDEPLIGPREMAAANMIPRT